MHTPLQEEHEKLGARWREWLGENVPGSYGDTGAEYTTLRQGAGVMDLSVLGKLRIIGDDRITYLQGQLSQDVVPLQTAGMGAYSCLLKPNGQMLSDMVLFATEDAVLVLTPPHTAQTVRERLEQFVIMEDVEIENVTQQLAVLHVAGKQANGALASINLQTQLELWHGQTVLWQGQPLHAVRTDRSGELGYDLIVPVEMAKGLWRYLLEAGVQPVGYEAWNIRRVEAGMPLFGIDMDETTIPLEAGLGERAISFTKGCYTGQEVIHRIYSRGHTNRSLVGLRLNEDMLPCYRAPISTSDREDAGWVTSVVRSLALGVPIALGYLRNEYTAPGTLVTIKQEPSPVPAEVTALPFVEPSRG